MKTNLVKKGSEKNIEMFKMNNDELATVNGGVAIGEWIVDEDGNLVFSMYRKLSMANNSFHSSN